MKTEVSFRLSLIRANVGVLKIVELQWQLFQFRNNVAALLTFSTTTKENVKSPCPPAGEAGRFNIKREIAFLRRERCCLNFVPMIFKTVSARFES